jgi:hypothetical protein
MLMDDAPLTAATWAPERDALMRDLGVATND